MTWNRRTTRRARLKRLIQKGWSNGAIMGALILIVAILIAWGKVVSR
jgi:hypothetical protein